MNGPFAMYMHVCDGLPRTKRIVDLHCRLTLLETPETSNVENVPINGPFAMYMYVIKMRSHAHTQKSFYWPLETKDRQRICQVGCIH